jgi:hypothetical protein
LSLGLLVVNTAQAQVITGATLATAAIPNPVTVVATVAQFLFVGGEKEYYVHIVSTDTDETAARNSGFKLAVNMAVGAVIASETEVVNREVVRDEIINYSSGFIDKFKITNSEPVPGGVRIEMDVWVKTLPIANRVLANSKTAGEIDGNRASIQIQTIKDQRDNADKLLFNVLKDFPRRAFQLELQPAEVTQSMITVPIKVRWDPNFIDSFDSVLKLGSVNRPFFCGSECAGDYTIDGYKFDSRRWMDVVMSHFYNTQPAVLITVRGGPQLLYRECQHWALLDHNEGFNVAGKYLFEGYPIYQWFRTNPGYRPLLLAQIPTNQLNLSQATTIEAQIIAGQNCPK